MISAKKYEAALLVAQDKLTNRQIAQRVGCGLRTLDKWKADPEFAAEVERLLNAWRAQIFERGIADRRRRIFRLNDRWRRCQAVIEQRARTGRALLKQLAESDDPPDLQPYPGIETGLIILKPTRYGTVAEVDTGLLAEIRALEQQAAIELGQWKTKHEITGADDGPLQVTAVKLAEVFTLEELETMRARLTVIPGGKPDPEKEPSEPVA